MHTFVSVIANFYNNMRTEVWSVENSEEKSPTKYSIVRIYQWIPTPLLPAGNFNQRKHGGQTRSDRTCFIS